ncbi:MAG: 1-phosphofructokinase [Lachnospiraceae bacterium]|nr:1-phosphofructokinase [Lachnospiraceae bacterium]
MIYTVTLNPSLDYIVDVENMELGMTNRTSYEQMEAGGKGINVSYVLRSLGLESKALGFLAGFTGEEIRRRLVHDGICAEFEMLSSGMSRINVKVRNIDGTEINGMGPDIPKDDLERFWAKLEGLQQGDVLVLAGSIPKSLPNTIYQDMMQLVVDRGVRVIVDASKDLLKNVLPYRPFLIKPNHHELGELFGVKIGSREEAIPYAKRLQEMGAVNVLVSLGGLGAVLIDEQGLVHSSEAPSGTVVNTVGSGDSMVAGFLAGWLDRGDYEYAFRMGLAAGSAGAFSDKLPTGDEIRGLLERMQQ